MARFSVLSLRHKRLTAAGSSAGDSTDTDSITRGCMRRSKRSSSGLSSVNSPSFNSHDGQSDSLSASGIDIFPGSPKLTVHHLSGRDKKRAINASLTDIDNLSDRGSRSHSPCIGTPLSKVPGYGMVRKRLPFARKSKKTAGSGAANSMEEIALGLPVTDGTQPRCDKDCLESPNVSPRASFDHAVERQKKLGQLSASERSAYVDFLRRELANGDPQALGLSDCVLSFIYRCHKEDLDRSRQAVTTFLKFKNFHTNNVKKGAVTVTPDMIARENLRRKNVISISPGANGNPVCISYMVARRHLRNGDTTLSEKVCALLYGLELTLEAVEERGADFYFVFDVKSVSVKNADVPFLQQIACLQKVFRDLMKKVYIVNGGPFVMGMWKVAKPLFSPRILEKIQVVKGDAFKKALPVSDHKKVPGLVQASWDLAVRKEEEAMFQAATPNSDFMFEDFCAGSPK